MLSAMNWKSLIQDLRDRGYTYQQIADNVAMSRGAVHDLHTGRVNSVLYEAGARIVELHKKAARAAARMRARAPEEKAEA